NRGGSHEVVSDITDLVLHVPLLIPRTGITGDGGEAVEVGKLDEFIREDRLGAIATCSGNGGTHVVDPDASRHEIKLLEDFLKSMQETFCILSRERDRGEAIAERKRQNKCVNIYQFSVPYRFHLTEIKLGLSRRMAEPGHIFVDGCFGLFFILFGLWFTFMPLLDEQANGPVGPFKPLFL